MKTKQTSEQKKQGSAACFRDIKRKKKTGTSAFNPIFLLSRSSETEIPQAKLNVKAPDDKSEQEADSMAERVVNNSPSSSVQEFNNGQTQSSLQRAEDEEAQTSVQRAEDEEAQTSVQRAEDEEAQTSVQRAEDEEAQTSVQRAEDEEAQTSVQRAEDEEAQTSVQRAEDEEAQTSVQRAEEEEAQTSMQRAEDEEAQAHSIITARGPPQFIQKSNSKESAQAKENKAARQRKETTGAFGSNRIEVVLAESKRSGRQLEPFTRAYMEERMSADFSAVRIHTDERAAWMCQRLNARAFAHAGHVYFNSGEYDTKSKGGKWLIAHELTHTIQHGVAPQQQHASQTSQSSGDTVFSQNQKGDGIKSFKQNSNIQPLLPNHHCHSHNQPVAQQTKNPESEPSEAISELEETTTDGKTFVPFNTFQDDSSGNRMHLSRRVSFLNREARSQNFSTVPVTGTYTAQRFWVSSSPNSNQDELQSATGLRGPPKEQHNSAVNRAVKPHNHSITARGPPTAVLQNTLSLSAPSLSTAQTSPAPIQRIPFGDDINEYANDVPGWRLLTVIVGYNPLTERDVDRTASNFLGGIIALMPAGSRLFDKLNEEGVVDEAFNWLRTKQQEVGITYNGLIRLAEEAWDEMSLIEGFSYNYNIVRRKVDRVLAMIIEFGTSLIEKVVELLREKLAPPLLEWIQNQTRAYPLLTVILSHDPITDEDVPRTIPAMIEGFLMLTETGEDYWNKLQESGKLDEAIAWLDATIQRYNLTPERITTAFTNLWDNLSWEDVLDPVGTFGKIYSAFADPVTDIIGFVAEVALKILSLVKDYFIGLLKEHADAIPGYPLLTVILEKDPLTGVVVPRTAMNFIKGFLSFVPDGMETYNNLEESGAIEKAFTWLGSEVEALDLTWEAIQNMFIRAWDLLTIESFLQPLATFQELMEIFAGPVQRLIRFAINVGIKILEFIFEGFLLISGPFGQRILETLKRSRRVFDIIWNDPIAFAMNIIRSVKKGLDQFVENILVHLRDSLIGWLFGSVADMITMPAQFNLMGIVDLGLQILGLTYDNFRTQLVERIGEENVARLETAFEFVRILVTEGLAAAWEKILEFGTDIIDGIIDGVKEMVIESIVKIGIQKLALLLAGPYGAIVEAIVTTYNFIKTLIERISQILDFVTGVLDSIEPIAMGNIGAAAAYVEQSLKRGLTLLISFLAGLIGLGGIPTKVRAVILRMHTAVSNAMGAVIDWVITRARSLFGMGDQSEGEAELEDVNTPFPTTESTQHSLNFDGDSGSITVHTVVHPLTEYLDRIENEASSPEGTPLTPAQQTAIVNIRALYPEIEALRSRTVNHSNGSTETRTDQPGVSGGQQVNTLLGQLTTELAKLPDPDADSGESSVMPPSTLVGTNDTISTPAGPAGLTADSIDGKKMEVRPLSINQGSLSGSRASYDSPLLTAVKARPSTYVAGHLLHAHLGGPGNRSDNLAPITVAANNSMSDTVENTIIGKINQENKVIHYTVIMHYPSSRSAAPHIPAEGFIPNRISFELSSMKLSPTVESAAENKSGQEKIDYLDAERAKPDSWVDDEALSAAPITNNPPVNTPIGTTDLNTTTGAQIASRAGVSQGFAAGVVYVSNRRPWVDKADVSNRLTAGANQGRVGNYRAQRSIMVTHINRLVGKINDDLTWQAKLKNSSSTDPYEQEADRVAGQVAGTEKAGGMQLPSISRLSTSVQSTYNGEDKSQTTSISHGFSSSSSGRPISQPVQRDMEGRMGADFTNVRLHTDSHAAQMSSYIGARAFTHGSNIYFNQGEYNPSSAEGKHLLAHELTHTVQQGASKPSIQKKEADNTISATDPEQASPVEKAIPISFAAADDPAKGAQEVKEKEDDTQEATEKPLPVSKSAKGTAPAPTKVLPDKKTPAKAKDGGTAGSDKEKSGKAGENGEGKQASTISSSDQDFLSLTSSTATSIARQYPGFGKNIEHKLASDAQRTEKEAPVLIAENTGKTAENKKSEQQLPTEEEAKVTEHVAESGKTKPVLKLHRNKAPPPNPTQNDRLLDQQKISVFISWFRGRFGGFLNGIATRDNGVNTSAGKRPKVKLTGKADPTRSNKNRTEGDGQATAKKDATQTLIKNNDGETQIQPVAVRQENNILISAAKKKVETKKQDDMQDYLGMDLPENVRQGADNSMAPMLDKSLAGERTKVKQGAKKRDTDKKTEVQSAKNKTAELNKKAKSDQDTEIKSRRQEITTEKQRGRKEADKLNDKYTTQADKEQSKTKKDIDKKVQEKEKEADQHLKDGEKKATAKKKEEESKAAVKKKELKKAQKKKSWWDRVCDAVKSAVKAITNAIKSIFKALRNAVAAIINAVKKLALAAIEAARKLVIGLLDAFGKFLKTLVNKFLKKLFPELAKKICKYIDKKIDQAKKAVNNFADKLKKGVEALANALTKVLNKILSVFETLLTAAVGIAGALLTGDFAEAFRIAIESACSIAGIDSKPIFAFFEKAGSLIGKILRSPGVFIKNVAMAGKKGVNLFKTNIVKHLVTGVIAWLTGAMSDVPITLPKKFNLKGIFSIVMQVLGLTYDRLRAKLIKEMGPGSEKVIGTIEKGVSFLMEVKNDFPMALWKKMKEKWHDIKEEAKSKIQETIIIEVVKAGIVHLLSMLNPVSAIVKAVIMLYKLIMFIVENKDKIIAFLNSLYTSISQIISGAIDPAAKSVEKTLARTIPLILGLLSKLLGLGGIGKSIQKTLIVIHSKVDKIINPIIKWVAKQGRKLLSKGKGLVKAGKQKLKNLFTWWKHKENFKAKDGSSHQLFFDGKQTSARLYVASKKTLYIDFLKNLKVDSADTKKTNALTEAKTVAGKIDAERAKTIAGNTDAAKKANQQKKATAIQKLMGKLRAHTALIMGSLEQSENPVYNPTSPNNTKFAKGTTAKKLTKQAPKSGAGTTPSMVKHSIYDLIDKRRQGEKGASYYIRGHLLNHNLYGKGEWHNMTPLTREANSEHEKQVESKVKAAVDSGDRVSYIITPIYGGQINEEKLVQDITDKDVGVAQQIKLKIVKAEQNVPTSMTCTAKSLNTSSSSFSITYTVDNTIGRSYADYQLGPVPKPDPVSLSKASLGDLTSHNRMTTAEAKAVIAVRKKDKKNFASYTELYTLLSNAIIKAKVEKLNSENLVKLF